MADLDRVEVRDWARAGLVQQDAKGGAPQNASGDDDAKGETKGGADSGEWQEMKALSLDAKDGAK